MFVKLFVAALFVLSSAGKAVDEDQKLPFSVEGMSKNGNIASLTGVTFSLSDPAFGTIEPPSAGDPGNVDGYFVPAGPLGDVVLTASGTNKKGDTVTGTLDITVVVGAAVTVEVTALEPVPIE